MPMTRALSPIALALCLAGLALGPLAPRVAHAQGDRAQARELSREAAELFKAKNYDAALVKFRAANDLVPHPVLDVNIGRCYEKLKDPTQALAHCKAALNSPGTPDAVRDAARECVDRAQKLIDTRFKLTVNSRPKGAKVIIDGLEMGRTPWVGEVDAGRRQVDLQADGYRPSTTIVFAEYGGEETVDEVLVSNQVGALLTLTTVPPGAAVTLDGQPIGETPIESYPLDVETYRLELQKPGFVPQVLNIDLSDGEHLTRAFSLVPFDDPRTAIRPSWPGWTSIGLGIATAGAAGLFGYWALDARSRADTLAKTSSNPLDRPAYESYLNDMERHRFSSDLLWGISGALVAGGITWLVWPD